MPPRWTPLQAPLSVPCGIAPRRTPKAPPAPALPRGRPGARPAARLPTSPSKGAKKPRSGGVSSRMEAPIAPPPPPAPPTVLTRLADAMRPGAEDERDTERNRGRLYERVFPTARSSRRRFADVSVERVRADADVVGIEWRVTPIANLSPEEKRSWAARMRVWQTSPEWRVTETQPGTYRVTEVLTLRDLARLVVSYFGEDDAGLGEIPRTVAPPVLPAAPLSPQAVKLITAKLMPRIAGEAVPLDALASLVSSLPGWQWLPGFAVVEQIDEKNRWDVTHRVWASLGLAKSATADSGYGHRSVRITFKAPEKFFPTPKHRAEFRAAVDALFASPGAWTEGDVVVDPSRKPRLFGRVEGWQEDGTFLVKDVWVSYPAVMVVNPRGPRFALTEDNGKTFWPWAFWGGLARDAESVLASLGPEVVDDYLEAMKYKPSDMALLARCQICGRVHMTRSGDDHGGRGPQAMVMVDHGYTYPHSKHTRGQSLGQRSGVCFGAKWQPYERSHAALDAYIPRVEDQIARLDMRIREMRRAIVDPSRRSPIEVRYGFVRQQRGLGWSRSDPEWFTVQPEESDWPVYGQMVVSDLLDSVKDAQARLRGLIARRAAWRLRPTFGERTKGAAAAMAKSDV